MAGFISIACSPTRFTSNANLQQNTDGNDDDDNPFGDGPQAEELFQVSSGGALATAGNDIQVDSSSGLIADQPVADGTPEISIGFWATVYSWFD